MAVDPQLKTEQKHSGGVKMAKIKAPKKTKEETVSKHLLPGYDYVMVAGQHSGCSIVRSTDPTIDGQVLGGFHTLCADVGEIPGHPLSGMLAGEILPLSLWNQRHKAACGNNDAMVYDAVHDVWCDIYLCRDNDSLMTNNTFAGFVSLAKSRKKRLPTDEEFYSFASGSNEMTNILGSNKPPGSGGHVDQLARRMISNIGCEDCCGVIWQWLRDTWKVDDTYGLFAGGYWANAADCGSRCRSASNFRWSAYTKFGARFVAEPLIKRGAKRQNACA